MSRKKVRYTPVPTPDQLEAINSVVRSINNEKTPMWSDFKITTGPVFKVIPSSTISPIKWYHRLFKSVTNLIDIIYGYAKHRQVRRRAIEKLTSQ